MTNTTTGEKLIIRSDPKQERCMLLQIARQKNIPVMTISIENNPEKGRGTYVCHQMMTKLKKLYLT